MSDRQRRPGQGNDTPADTLPAPGVRIVEHDGIRYRVVTVVQALGAAETAETWSRVNEITRGRATYTAWRCDQAPERWRIDRDGEPWRSSEQGDGKLRGWWGRWQ